MDRFAAFETLVAVIETGSFSAAARRLKVGQPAVSKSIAQLESTLGVLLFMRSTRGLSPTESGQSFYVHARLALDEANEAEMAARGASANLRGVLRVSAAVTFARLHIVPYRAGTEVSVTVSGRVSASAAEGVRAAVLGDMGLAIASKWMFAPELASGQVKQVLSDWTLEPTDLWALYPTGRMASARAKAFVEFVKVTLAKGEP